MMIQIYVAICHHQAACFESSRIWAWILRDVNYMYFIYLFENVRLGQMIMFEEHGVNSEAYVRYIYIFSVNETIIQTIFFYSLWSNDAYMCQ